MERLGHGSYSSIAEEDFLSAVTSSHTCVVHFSLDEFERCKILDKHLQSLSQKYFQTRFMKANAPDLPFFTEKLNVKVLPCLILFKNGVAFDRIVGFEDFGNKDDYKTMALEKRLLEAGAVEEEEKAIEEEEKGDEQIDKEEVMRELANRRMKRGFHKTESDEDSDFDWLIDWWLLGSTSSFDDFYLEEEERMFLGDKERSNNSSKSSRVK